MRLRRVAAVGIASVAIAVGLACSSAAAPSGPATVRFVGIAPFCGTISFAVNFLIDSVVVGADTFRVNPGGTSHTVDSVLTPPGTHRIGGRTPWGYAFGGDITAVLAPGASARGAASSGTCFFGCFSPPQAAAAITTQRKRTPAS